MREILLLLCFFCCSLANGQAAPTSIQADTLALRQTDGSVIHIIGFGSIFESYTETVDGYTIVLNKKGLYEYAHKSASGDLLPSGIRASDIDKRSPKEQKYIRKLLPHLRYSGAKLRTLQEKQTLFNAAPLKHKPDSAGRHR